MAIGTIIIVAYDRENQTLQLLRSLRCTVTEEHRLVVVDNASPNGFAKIFERYADELAPPDYVLIRNRANVAFGPALNQAIDAAIGRFYAILCGNGCISVGPWFGRTAEFFQRHPDYGLAGYLSYHNYLVRPDYARKPFSEVPPYLHVQGGIMMVNAAMVEDIGEFSPRWPFLFNDVEYSNRALACGWRLGSLPFVYSRTGDNVPLDDMLWHDSMKRYSLLHHVSDYDKRERFLTERLGERFASTAHIRSDMT